MNLVFVSELGKDVEEVGSEAVDDEGTESKRTNWMADGSGAGMAGIGLVAR